MAGQRKMIQSNIILFYLLFIAVGIIFGSFGVWAVGKIAMVDPDAVNIVIYAFFLTAIVGWIVDIVAIIYGVIDRAGSPVGAMGERFMFALNVMIDIKSDFFMVTVPVAIFVVPQILTYIFSGLPGCASKPLYVPQSMRILIWLFAKSLASGSGVLFSTAIIGLIYGWAGFDVIHSSQIILVSVCFISMSFFFVKSLKDSQIIAKEITSDRKYIFMRRIHAWFMRHRTEDEVHVIMRENGGAESHRSGARS